MKLLIPIQSVDLQNGVHFVPRIVKGGYSFLCEPFCEETYVRASFACTVCRNRFVKGRCVFYRDLCIMQANVYYLKDCFAMGRIRNNFSI